MSILNRIKSFGPKGFFWKITILNVTVIIIAIGFSSWTIYNTACFLVDNMGWVDESRQQQFNITLFQYLLIFSLLAIVISSLFHFYITKRLMQPIRKLIDSTKKLKSRQYPELIDIQSTDEIGELIYQYNDLVQELQMSEQYRDQFVADFSHEFRTPLANINGYLHALSTGVIEGDEQLYESLYKESSRLTEMIEQLDQLKHYDYTQSSIIINKQCVNIADEIQQCALMFNWVLEKKAIPLKIDVENSDVFIQVEGIHQVINNLLENAILYYEGVGPIILKGKQLKETYQVSVIGPSKQIQAEKRPWLFKRFYRLDNSRSRETGGSGLGLAIAKEIVEQHNGNIEVVEVEAGNCFSFTIERCN